MMFVQNDYITTTVIIIAIFSFTSNSISSSVIIDTALRGESVKLLEEGNSFDLECTVPNIGNGLVAFVKTYKNRSYDIAADLLKHYDGRNVSVEYEKGSKTYLLKIDSVVRSDVGTYSCEYIELASATINKDGKCLKSTTLAQTEVKILSPPEITGISISANSVHEGNPVTLECYASGYPEPIVFWKRDDNSKINSAGVTKYPKNVLKIIPATKKDAGVYQCWAENSVGEAVTRSVKLNVFGKKQLTTEKYDITESIYEDEE